MLVNKKRKRDYTNHKNDQSPSEKITIQKLFNYLKVCNFPL